MGLVIAALTYFRCRNLDGAAALSGFSPEQLALAVNHPEHLVGDYPSGILNNLNSIVYHVYPAAERLGITVTFAWASMILLEICLFAGAAVYAARRLMPDGGWPLAAIVAITYSSSALLSPDMARIEFPYYGWVYGFAHACFLMVVVETICRRYTAAAIVLVAQFTVHPIMAVFGGMFVGASMFWELASRRVRLNKLVVPSASAAAGCGAWLLWIGSRSTITGGAIDADTFVALNRAQNYHWFPSYLGLYWENHWQELLPLLSTLALVAWSCNASRLLRRDTVRQLAFGVILMMTLCCIGLLIAEFVPVPVLVKLALHRADTPALLIGGLLILPALYRDVIEGDVVERMLAALLLLLPFASGYGLLPVPVTLRIGYAAFKAWKTGSKLGSGMAIAGTLVVLTWTFAIVYKIVAHDSDFGFVRYVGLYPAVFVVAGVVAILPRVWRWKNEAFLGVCALCAVTIAGLIHTPRLDMLGSAAVRRTAANALEAQLWARANTPDGSLFMVAPEFNYMWRDKSHRPSFGTPREWLLISVLYDSNKSLLEEGLRRYSALGLAPPNFIYDPAERRMAPMMERLYGDASEKYYAMRRSELEALAVAYNIRYFVYSKGKLSGDPPFPTVFQNADFVITAAP